MRVLRQKDLRLLVALVDSFDHVEERARPGRVTAGLHTIVPGVVASYNYASRRELERLDLYQAVYRPLGITDQISIALPGPGTVTIGVAMGRERRGFSQRERLLLELLRPHLAIGPLRAAREPQLHEARAALHAASSAAHPGAVEPRDPPGVTPEALAPKQTRSPGPGSRHASPHWESGCRSSTAVRLAHERGAGASRG